MTITDQYKKTNNFNSSCVSADHSHKLQTNSYMMDFLSTNLGILRKQWEESETHTDDSKINWLFMSIQKLQMYVVSEMLHEEFMRTHLNLSSFTNFFSCSNSGYWSLIHCSSVLSASCDRHVLIITCDMKHNTDMVVLKTVKYHQTPGTVFRQP